MAQQSHVEDNGENRRDIHRLHASFVARQPAVYRLPHEVGQRQLGVLSAHVGQVPFNKLPKPKRSSNSRTRTNPPSEVTREPWKSTFNELLNES